MIKRFDKKGQSVVSSPIVNWIIAGAVILIIFLGIYFFVLKGETIGENIPSNVEVIKSGCSAALSGGLEDSYCNQIREIGNNKYITCDYAIKQNYISIEDSEAMNKKCLDQEAVRKNRILQQIEAEELKDSILINSQNVSMWKA